MSAFHDRVKELAALAEEEKANEAKKKTGKDLVEEIKNLAA